MALFQKNPHTTRETKPLFTISSNKTVLIVGLGNIGKKYEQTRHNIGFVCIDEFAKSQDFDPWTEKKDFKCLMTSANLGDTRVILCKPTTYMNLSGEAVQKLAHFYKVPTEKVLAVHDDLDINFGQIRMRVGGSHGGNNGIKSMISHIGAGFGRVRVGIGNELNEQINSADFVLSKFAKEEKQLIPSITKETTSILTEYIFSEELPHDTRSLQN